MEHERLEWSEWHPWRDILSARVQAPGQPGVYEARRRDQQIRLTIGETNHLVRRVSYLIRGNGPHSAGERIRGSESVADLLVRWAVTEHHVEVEERLHREHRDRFGCLPVHTRETGRARPARSTSP